MRWHQVVPLLHVQHHRPREKLMHLKNQTVKMLWASGELETSIPLLLVLQYRTSFCGTIPYPPRFSVVLPS